MVKSTQPSSPEHKRDYFTRFKSKSSNNLQQFEDLSRNQNKIDTISETQIHSSTIYFEDNDSLYYSALDLNFIKQNKISSTVLNNVTFKPDISQISNQSNAAAINSPASPCLQRSKSITSFQTAVDEFEFTKYHSYGCKTTEMDSINSGVFLETTENQINNQLSNQVYICVSSYLAKNQGDLTLEYSDKVLLLHSNNDMCLVQNLNTKQCGYVPSTSIKLDFLN